jgi:hypothetical protein
MNTYHKATSCKLGCFNLSRAWLVSTSEVFESPLSSASIWCQTHTHLTPIALGSLTSHHSNLNQPILRSGGGNALVTSI